MSHSIGVDVGGTTSTISIGDKDHQVVHVSDQFSSSTAKGPDATVQAILDEIHASLEKIGQKPDEISDIGLATPGPASLDGVLLRTPNFDPRLWDEFPFRATLEKRFREWSPNASVHYIGDGQAAALGEYSVRTGAIHWNRVQPEQGSNRDLTSLFMVVVGTGLGGGEVEGGQVVRGLEGRAGHAGHIMLPPYAFRYEHDQQLRVGNATCTVESAVSLTALTHQLGYRLTLEQWRDHPLTSHPGTIRDKAKQLRDLASEGDELAMELFTDQARALGIALLAVNYLGDYDLLVIGGGVCDMADDVREHYRKTAEAAYLEYALDGFRNLDRLEFSVCGDESPVIGALAYAYSNSKRNP